MKQHTDVNTALNSMMGELNLTYSSEELLDEGLRDMLTGVGRGIANAGRSTRIGASSAAASVAGAVTDASHSITDSLETTSSIARQGLILTKGTELFGVRGATTQAEVNDITRAYQAHGYSVLPQGDPKRQQLASQNFPVIGPDKLVCNLKKDITPIVAELVTAAQSFAKMVNSRQLVTESTIASGDLLSNLLNLVGQINTVREKAKDATAPAATLLPPTPTPSATPKPVAGVEPSTTTPPPSSTTSEAPARAPLDFNNQPMAPDAQGLSAGAEQLQQPEVKQRLGDAAAKDSENPTNAVVAPPYNPSGAPASNTFNTKYAESKNLTSPLDVFLG